MSAPEEIVHPDTEAGAMLALKSCCSRPFFTKVKRLAAGKEYEWRPGDLPGLWRFGEVDEDAYICRMIVYLAGYNGRKTSDFEESLP